MCKTPVSITAPPSSEDDIILSTLALPSQTEVARLSEPYSENDDYDSEDETVVQENVEEEEDSSRNSDVSTDDWLPNSKSG